MSTRLLLTALAASAALSACTSVAGSSLALQRTSHPAGRLCGHVGAVTSLVVHRTTINDERFAFPATVEASGAAARAVVRALCSLPPTPPGVRFCPDAYGPIYHLTFLDRSAIVSVDLVEPTGCASAVEGWNTSHSVSLAPTARFWRAIGSAVGVRGANEATFAGVLENDPPKFG